MGAGRGHARARARSSRGPTPVHAAFAQIEHTRSPRSASSPGARDVTLDLGDLRGFDYYTGLRFAGYAPGAPEAVLRGGRYDELIGRYGRAARATGFAIDLEAIAQAQRAAGIAAPVPAFGIATSDRVLARVAARGAACGCVVHGRGFTELASLAARRGPRRCDRGRSPDRRRGCAGCRTRTIGRSGDRSGAGRGRRPADRAIKGLMSVVIVVGAQWGDEGKGKVVDLFTERANVVVRYGGGANAGHTLVIDGRKLVTHLVPSRRVSPRQGLRARRRHGDRSAHAARRDRRVPGTRAADAQRAPDRARCARDPAVPQARSTGCARITAPSAASAIGTTRRGIGPAYEAKAARAGVRVRDLLSPSGCARWSQSNLDELVPVIEHLGGTRPSSGRDRALDRRKRSPPARSCARYTGDAGRHVARAIAGGPARAVRGRAGLPARSRSRHVSRT